MGNRIYVRPFTSKYSLSTRIISGVLAAVFILSQSAYGFVLPLPTNLGRVTDNFAMSPESNQLPRVIHIRTVHMNYKVQKKIEKILEHLTRENNVKVIGLEGADVPINPDRAFLVSDPDIRYQVADDLAKEGLVTGAELFAIKAPKDIRILGVEDPKLYQANLSDLRYIASQKDKAQVLIDDLKRRAERLESVILPREAQQLLLHRRKFETQQDGLLQFFHFLDEKAVQFGMQASPEQYPAMAQLFTVEDLSKFIEKSDAQIKTDWEAFKKLEKLSAGEDMESYLILHEIDRLNFPRLGAFKNYLELAEEVNESSHLAVDEAYELEQKIIYGILLKLDETALVEIENDLNDIHHLNDLTLLRERVEEVESRLNSLKYEKLQARLEKLEKSYNRYTETAVESGQAELFDGTVLRALSFYQLARERDYAMMRNFVDSLKEGERGVFITGGFHSDGIMKLMRDLNISYSVILPKVEEITEHDSYLRSFLPQSAINKKDSVQNAQFEPGLFSGNVWLDPATVAPKRIQSLAGQVSLATQRGFPIELSESQLGPRPEGVERVTLTSHTSVEGLPVLDVSIRLQDGTEAGIVVDGRQAIVTGPNEIETFDVDSLVGLAYEKATGFGTQPLPFSGKLSKLAALAISVLAWCIGCDSRILPGGVTTNVTTGPGGITGNVNIPLPFGSINLSTTVREFPSSHLLGDARQINSNALTEDKILAETPYTIGPGVFPGDRGPITSVQNQNGADFITSSQEPTGIFDVSWYSPDNLDDMRDFFNDDGIFIRGQRPEYAGWAFDFSPTAMDTLGDETPGAADGLILFRRAQAPGAQLPEDGDTFYLVVRETRQSDGTYFIEPVLDQNGQTVFRPSLTEWMKFAGGSSKEVAELIETGEAVPVLRFNVSAEDIRTFGGGKQIQGEVHFGDPQRVKIDLNGNPVLNEDGSFVYSHEPFVTGTFEYTEGLGEATVTMVIDPDVFSKLPIRELVTVFTTGPAFLKDVDEDGDGLDDPAGTYPYYLGLGRIKNPVIIAADPSALNIPYRTSMKTRTGLDIQDDLANEQIYADFLAQSIDFAASEAAKSADGQLATVNMKNPNGFGAIPPIRISTIKNGIVHIASASRDALTSEKAKKIMHALAVAVAAGLSMCGGSSCGTNDSFSVSVDLTDDISYIFGPTPIPDQPDAGAIVQNPGVDDVEDLLDDQIPDGEIVPVPPQDGMIQPLPVVPARINPEAVVARVPLTSVFGTSPVISVSDSNAIVFRRGFWDPENPEDSAMRVDWFNPPDLGMSQSVAQPTFVGLAVQGAFGPDRLPIGTEQSFIQFLKNIAAGLRQDRALQDEAGRPMTVIEELAKSYDDMAALLDTTTDAELAPVWDLQIALDAEPVPIKVEIKIEGFDAQTGELITIAAAKKTLRGGMVNFVPLELTRDILKRNMRQLTVVANLGSPTLADGSLNPNYVSKGRMIIIGNQLVLAERDQDGNLSTFPGPSQVALSEYKPRAIVADNEIRTVTNAFLTNRHNAAFTFPRNAPPLELEEPDSLISLGDLDHYFVDLLLSPPPEAQDLANTTPDVQFGGYVDRLDLPFGVAPVETPDGPALPPGLPSVRTLVETFDRLADVIRNTAAVEFGPGVDGEARKEAEALKWERLAQDAREGYRIGVEFVVDAAEIPGRPNNVVIPVSLKIEGVDPLDSESSLAPSTSVQTIIPGKTSIIREVLPASVVNNPAINIDQISFVLEAGKEFQLDLFGEPLLDEQGNPVPNPLHVEEAQIRLRSIKFFSAERPAETEDLSTISKLMGFATPRGQKILQHNPRLADALADSLELGEPVREGISQTYFQTGGIAPYFTTSVKRDYTLLRKGVVRTGPLTFSDVPLFGILPTLSDISNRLQQEVTTQFGEKAVIAEVRFVTPEQFSSAVQRPGVRPLRVNGVSFAAVELPGDQFSLAATPEGAAALRAQIATGFGIQNAVASDITLIRSGISPRAQLRPVGSEVTWQQILGFMSNALGSAVTSGTVGKLFEPRAEGTEQELSIRVVTDLAGETLRQVEFDLSENPNAFYAYLDTGLAPATNEAQLVQNMTALYPNQFIRLPVPQDHRTSYGAAQYLNDFLTGQTREHANHESEQHLLNQVLNKLPIGKTQADVPAFAFIAASPEIISAANELGLDEAYKLIMEPQTRRENRIGLGFFGMQVLRMGVGAALREELLEPTPDAIRFNTFKPSASVMASLSQIYAAYMQALQAFSVSA